MKKYSQFPPVLLARATGLYLRERVYFPKKQNRDSVYEDEKFVIFRKVVVGP